MITFYQTIFLCYFKLSCSSSRRAWCYWCKGHWFDSHGKQ